jgi:hypothetical protein
LYTMAENKIITMGDPSQFPTPEEMQEIMESEFGKKKTHVSTNPPCEHCPRKKVCFHFPYDFLKCVCVIYFVFFFFFIVGRNEEKSRGVRGCLQQR